MMQAPSGRTQKRLSAKARREAGAAVGQVVFDALAAGWLIEQIAELRKVSPRTVRREVDRTLAERRLDAPIATPTCRSPGSPRRCASPTTRSTGES